MVSLFHKRNQVGILLNRYNQHALIRVFAGVGVRHDVEQSVGFDGENDFLERNIPLGFQLFVLLVAPTKRLHLLSLAERVPFVISWQVGLLKLTTISKVRRREADRLEIQAPVRHQHAECREIEKIKTGEALVEHEAKGGLLNSRLVLLFLIQILLPKSNTFRHLQ